MPPERSDSVTTTDRRSRWSRQLAFIVIVALLAGAGVGGWRLVAGDQPGESTAAMLGHDGGTVRVTGLDVRVPAGAFPVATELRVERVPEENTELLDPIAIDRSSVYRIESDRPPLKPVELRFTVTGAGDHKRLVAATRAKRAREWEFLPGRVQGGAFVVKTDHFSDSVVQELKEFGSSVKTALRDLTRGFQQAIGVRAKKPECADSSDVSLDLRDDEPDDPLLYGCARRRDGREEVLLQIVNNRAIALDFDVPDGMRIARTEGHGLNEKIWDTINSKLPTGGRLVPGGGAVVLEGEPTTKPIEFKPTNQALVFDVLMVALTSGRGQRPEKAVAELGGGVGCFWSAAEGRDSGPAELLRDVWADCAGLLGPGPLRTGGLFLGSAQLAQSLFDQWDILKLRTTKVSAELRVRPRLPQPRPAPRGVAGPLTVNALGSIELGMSKAEVEAATGVRFGGGGPFCDEPIGGPEGVFIEYDQDDRVAAIGLVRGSTFATASGLRVGDPVSKASTIYGSNLIQVAGPHSGDKVGQGTDLVYKPQDPPDNAYQLDIWTLHGRIIGIYAVLAGDVRDEFCA